MLTNYHVYLNKTGAIPLENNPLFNTKPLSHSDKAILLARIAHNLTVSARSTYIAGTEDIAEPRVLRAYNELLHRVTSSVRSHVDNTSGMPFEAVLQMMHDFGKNHNRSSEMDWVLKFSMERPIEKSNE